MKRSLLLCFLSLCIAGSAAAQPTLHLLGSAKGINASTLATEKSLVFSVEPSALATAYASPHFVAADVPIPTDAGTQNMSLDVSEFTVFGPETRFIEQHGDVITELPMPSVKLYRGHVVGKTGSFAYLAITPSGKVSGQVRVDGAEYTIGYPKGQPMTSLITPTSAIPYAADRARCVMTDEQQYDMKSSQRYLADRNGLKSAAPQSVQAATKTAIVAFDADYACYQSYGGVQEVTDYLTSIMGAITSVYETELDMAMQIGTVKVWTSADPYSGNDMNSLLSSFTSTWNTVPGNSSISRTMTHLMDNRLGSGSGAQGLAWVDVMCDPDHGFGLTNVTGNTAMPSLDEEVMAHELGHNVGSYHTHNCTAYPPNGIDHCVANDGGGGCSWTPQQVTGTIMSYCNNRTFTFGQRVIDTLKVRIDAAPCLQSLASIQVKTDSVVFPHTQVATKHDTVLKDIVKSVGSVPLRILGVQFVALDGNNGEFALKNAPKFPITVAAGSTQSFTVTYTPGASGPNYQMMVIYHNAQGGSDTIYLDGQGTQQHAYAINSSLDYGTVSDRIKHDTTIDFVGNDGDAPLTITKFVIDGTDASMFSITPPSALPIVIAPYDSIKMGVSFTAASNGLKIANLKAVTNDPLYDTTWMQLTAIVEGLGVADAPLPAGVTLSMSPNPTSGTVRIALGGLNAYVGTDLTASLYDHLGKRVATVFHGMITTPSVNLQWQKPSSIAAGSYTMVFEAKSMKVARTLIIE